MYSLLGVSLYISVYLLIIHCFQSYLISRSKTLSELNPGYKMAGLSPSSRICRGIKPFRRQSFPLVSAFQTSTKLQNQGWIQRGGQDVCTPLRFQNNFSIAHKGNKT